MKPISAKFFLSKIPSNDNIFKEHQLEFFLNTVDMVGLIFAMFWFLRGGQIREFKNLAKVILMSVTYLRDR